MFELITPVSYWVLTILWLVILGLYLGKLRKSKVAGGAVAVLLTILAIDAFRTVFESVYFGLYFNSLFGLLPKGIHDVLSQPELIIIPKILNVVAGLLVLFLLIRRWVPREIREREEWIQGLQDAKLLAEEKKEEAEQQFLKLKAIFNAISDVIVFADTDRRIIATNQGMEKTFGYTIDDLAGKNTTLLYESEEEHKRQGRLRFNLSAEEQSEPYEVKYRRKDGEIFVGETLGAVIKGAKGKVHGYIGVIRDITERIHLEDQLRRSQKMDAVGQLTGGIAHDFNNLLGVMIGNAELLEDVTKGNEKARRNINAIIKAANRGASLTMRLLAFSRQQTLSPQPTAVNSLVTSLEDMLKRTLGETIELHTHLGPGACEALIDPHQLEDALLNLSINARDAMPKGGTLSIEATNVTVDGAYAAGHEAMIPGDYVKVTVTDTGSGMAPDVLEKVFEPFFTTKGVGEGSGLGLSMVYGFVKQSDGYIEIESEVGRGTTIKLYLPQSTESATQHKLEEERPKLTPGSERILIVEDDADLRDISTTILEDQGYEVVEVKDGNEAIKRLQEGPPFDLLFTDVVLPGGMNGVEIAEEANRIQPNIKALFTSGYAEDTIAHKGKLGPGVNLIYKPFLRTDLLEKVRGTLDSKED